MGERGNLTATYRVLANGKWQPIGEVGNIESIEAYELEIEPISFDDTRWSFEIRLDPVSQFFFWWLEWQHARAVPKIARK